MFCEVTAEPGQSLRDGRFLSGEVHGQTIPGVMALDEVLLTGDDGNEVFVVRDSQLALAQIEVLHRDADRVLVRGLKEGEQVVSEPVSGAYEGMLVERAER